MIKIIINIFIIILIIFLNFIFFFNIIFWGESLYTGDHFYYFVPYRYILHHAFREFTIPLINPFNCLGEPFFANPQAAVLYPFSLLLLLKDFFLSYNLSIVIHSILASIFMLLFLRRYGFTLSISLFGSIAFTFGGTLLSFINRLDKYSAAIYLPLAFYFFLNHLEKKRFSSIGLAMTLGLQFLSGGLEILGFTLLSLFLWGIFYPSPKKGIIRKVGHLFDFNRFIITSLALFALLFAFQIIPSTEFLLKSNRNVKEIAEVAHSLSMSPLDLFTIFIPNLFYNTELQSVQYLPHKASTPKYLINHYCGLLTFVFFLYGLICELSGKGGRRIFNNSLLFFLFLLLSMGEGLPYLESFESIPPLLIPRYPEKFFLVSFFFIVIIACRGLSLVEIEEAERPEDGFKIIKRPNYEFPFLLLIIPLITLIVSLSISYLIPGHIGIFKKLAGLDLDNLDILTVWLLQRAKWLKISSLLSLASVLLILSGYRGTSIRPLIPPAISLLLFVDLMVSNQSICPSSRPERIWGRPQLIEKFPEIKDGYRYLDYSTFTGKKISPHPPGGFKTPEEEYIFLNETIYPNTGSIEGVAYSAGKRAIRLQIIDEYFGWVESLPLNLLPGVLRSMNCGFLGIYGSPFEKRIDGIERLFSDRDLDFTLYRIKDPYPLLFIPEHVVMYKKEDEADGSMVALLQKREKTIVPWIFEGERGFEAITDIKTTRAEITGVRYSFNSVAFSGRAERQGYIVLLNIYYPGWRVKIGGRSERIIPVNRVFMGAKIPQGEFEGEFYFLPSSLLWGSVISIITLLIILLRFYSSSKAGLNP